MPDPKDFGARSEKAVTPFSAPPTGRLLSSQPGLAIPRLRTPLGTRFSVTPDSDMIVRRALQSEVPRLESAELYRAIALIPFSRPTSDAYAAGASWFIARSTWRVAPITIQLKGSLVQLIGHHLLSIVGAF
jgi:hypothetical protein